MSRLRVVAPDVPPTVEPGEPVATDDAPSPGSYIREQRQRHGMSVEQLAVATKIPASSLRRLEDDDFEALPGPVFVKGFLRCCTRALGLPSETVMELLYERERAALNARRQQQPAANVPARPSVETEIVEGPATGPSVPTTEEVTRNDSPAAEPARGGLMQRALTALPGAHTLLWLVVAAFVAVLVMAAFDLAGSGPIAPNS